MMRRIIPLLAAVLLLSLGHAASAQSSDSGLAPMSFFNGAWTCKRLSHPDKTAVGTQFAFNGSLERGGSWELLQFSDGQLNASYDPILKRFVFLYLGNTGEYGMFTSPGWKNGVLRLSEAVTSDGERLGAATFTRHGASVFTSSYAAPTSKGVVIYTNICAK
jgi:hypothetical protein